MKKVLFRVSKYGVFLDGEFVKRTERMTFYSAGGQEYRCLTSKDELVVETGNAGNLLGKGVKEFEHWRKRIAEAEKVVRDLRENQASAVRAVLEGK